MGKQEKAIQKKLKKLKQAWKAAKAARKEAERIFQEKLEKYMSALMPLELNMESLKEEEAQLRKKFKKAKAKLLGEDTSKKKSKSKKPAVIVVPEVIAPEPEPAPAPKPKTSRKTKTAAKSKSAKKTPTNGRRKRATTTSKAATTPKTGTTTRRGRPRKVASASEGDDLKKIVGIGANIEARLHRVGIDSFEKLAKASPDILKSVLEQAGPRYAFRDPSTWPAQAALAAKGDWDALKEMQEPLIIRRGPRKKK